MSEALDEKDLRIFRELVKSSVNYDYDLNTQYGPEVGFKTILHLALEEEDGFPYVEELLSVGNSIFLPLFSFFSVGKCFLVEITYFAMNMDYECVKKD